MANGDYGYFGKGDTGYAQYMTAFNRNFGGSSGGGGGGDGSGCGCLIAIAGSGRAGAYCHGKLRAYREIVDGIFLDRPNHFIAHVDAPHNNHLRERLMVLAQELERLTMDLPAWG